MEYRIEKDTLGEVKVEKTKLWGPQTQRSIENFKIGEKSSMPIEIIKSFAFVKKAAAFTNHELGKLSIKKRDLISEVCDEIIDGKLDAHFPLVIWQTGSGTQTNMNLNEVISNRAHTLLGGTLGDGKKLIHPNDDCNMSQSSNDTFPTAMNIASIIKIKKTTIPGIKKLIKSLIQKSIEFKNIIKIGRTHMMDATPVTLGQEFSAYAAQLNYGLKSLKNSLNHLSEIALGATAVGTGLNSPKKYDIISVKFISKFVEFPFTTAKNKFESISSHDSIVETHGALKLIAVSLNKIANDIRFLSSGPRSGIGEIILPSNEPGSSIMPGKINPTQCEALTMVCSQVIGNDTSISLSGAQGNLQLNVFKPVMAYNMIQSARLIGDSCQSFSLNCIDGILPNIKKIKFNLDNSLMLVTALNSKIGYYKAAEIANKAYLDDITLKEACLKLKYLSESEFDEIVDPKKMI
tara:strand:- start:192 stop:1577 length:1386 start_codon:yes stop_codon:yes gene_type:complete